MLVDNINHEQVDVVNLGSEIVMVSQRRDELIEVAASLLDAGGPAAVTMRAVGEAAGISHNAPYKHFRDKDDLLAAIAAAELTRMSETLADSDGGVRKALKGYISWARSYPERFRLTFGRWANHHDRLHVAASESRAGMIAIVKRAQAQGELPAGEPERLSSLLLALAHGAADLAQSGHLEKEGKGRADPEDLVDDLLRFLRSVQPR